MAVKRGSMHDARHDVMECLAEMIWQAQRNGTGFDNAAYLECLQKTVSGTVFRGATPSSKNRP
jgi:hypothetical protein